MKNEEDKEVTIDGILDAVGALTEDPLSATYILMIAAVCIGREEINLNKKQLKLLLKEAVKAHKRNKEKSCNT